MDSHGNRNHSADFMPDEEDAELAQRLRALHTTVKVTPAALRDGLECFEFVQDDLPFGTVFGRPGAWIPVRREKVYFSSVHANGWVLIRDADGTVSGSPYGHISKGCHNRQYFLLTSFALVLHWKAVAFLASYFGAYEAHVTWSMIGLFLGINKQTLVDVFLSVCAFVRAPLATPKSIYDMEMEFRGRLQEEATIMRRLRQQPNTSTGLTSKSSFHMRLCFFAVVESAAFHYAGFEMGYGLCCLYFAWFTTLSVFGV